MWLSMCLLAVLGSQGIEEKCTAAILDLTVHFIIQLYLSPNFIFVHVISLVDITTNSSLVAKKHQL